LFGGTYWSVPDDTARENSMQQAANTDVAVVITHYRNPEDLRRCLESVTAVGGSRVTEVWVADSEAATDTRALVAATSPMARYLPFRRNVGFAALVNMGAAASRASYVLVLNADVELTEGAIETLAAYLDLNPETGVAFPQLRYPDDELQHSVFAFHRPTTVFYRRTPLGRLSAGRRELARFLDPTRLERAVETGENIDVDWALGASMLIRRETLLDVGPLDEEYFLYFEDVDWCLRVWKAGWQCRFVPAAVCRHDYGRGSSVGGMLGIATNPLLRWHIRSAIRFFAKHGPQVARPAVPSPRRAVETRNAPLLMNEGAGLARAHVPTGGGA
jgi:N-acetylglucosaminyl-diphospho-decaprenol L-rhamnosyltransferase